MAQIKFYSLNGSIFRSVPRMKVNFKSQQPRLFVRNAVKWIFVLLLWPWLNATADELDQNSSFAVFAASNQIFSVKILLPHTRFATRCYTVESGAGGPTVLITGGVHGDEPAGVFASEAIRHWPLKSGRLVIIPAANVPALAANKRLTPEVSSDLNNLNRNFPRADDTHGASARGELAQAIWKIAGDSKPDWVLDLHEGFDFHQLNEKSTGSSIICFPNSAGQAAAEKMLAAVNATITNSALKFIRRNLPVDGSFARAVGEQLHVPAMIVETTSKQQPLATRVRQQEIIVHRLLAELGMVPDEINLDSAAENFDLRSIITPPRIIVAIYKGAGTGGKGPPNLLRQLNTGGETSLTQISPEEISAGALTNFDVVIFAGGSASKQSAALSEAGGAQVRQFVANGGGYIGICAGAYLATCSSAQRLHLINASALSPQWQRGRALLKVEITPAGAEILGGAKTNLDVMYHNGPVVGPAGDTHLPPYETLAFFRTETAQNNTPKGIMVNSPAIFAAPFQRGKVICISPHPEQTDGLDYLVPQAVKWVAGKTQPIPTR